MLIKLRFTVGATVTDHGATAFQDLQADFWEGKKGIVHNTPSALQMCDAQLINDKTRMQDIPHAVNASAEQTGHDMCLSKKFKPSPVDRIKNLTFITKLKVDILISA